MKALWGSFRFHVSMFLYQSIMELLQASWKKGAGHLQGSFSSCRWTKYSFNYNRTYRLKQCQAVYRLNGVRERRLFLFFYVMGEKLAYRVIDISVVLPSEMDRLTIQKGKDYCTLVTCTPYGVNSHRLLVKGERTEYTEAVKRTAKTSKQKQQHQNGKKNTQNQL